MVSGLWQYRTVPWYWFFEWFAVHWRSPTSWKATGRLLHLFSGGMMQIVWYKTCRPKYQNSFDSRRKFVLQLYRNVDAPGKVPQVQEGVGKL